MSEKTIKTLAKQAQDELQEKSGNASILQGAFATRNYEMSSVRLQTTLQELDILNGTPAMVRQGFEQDNTAKTITIPTIFAKINGVPESRREYDAKFAKITESDGLQALFNFHLSDGEWQIDEQEAADILSDLTVEKLIATPAWEYDILARSLQKKIAIAIIETFEQWDFTFPKTAENKRAVLRMCLDMPRELLEMSNEVDYPNEVPLLAVQHTEDMGELSRDDIIGYNIMHHLGWDVEIYSPNGFASIENVIAEDHYDEFYYPKMASTDAAKGDEKSFWAKIKAFFKNAYLKVIKLFTK